MSDPSDREHRASICDTLIFERTLVGSLFGLDICACPVWDMLLDLYRARQQDKPLYCWPVTVAAQVPTSTAYRKLEMMERRDLVTSLPPQKDRRQNRIELTSFSMNQMDRLMDQMWQRCSKVPPSIL
ncbi:MarR family winged helix-turn-helix transcriptional regulator [Sphingobium subterraneum]|uniref:MarR family transcriptional regulator n=1 Tax=Sphingobium subterraneum TaxID=627688 RepID=A0A841IZX2_9SPHN|nr:MarR family winged helix-turn-helix transcriptional regulator [Sphingobium subterraneum]MBB6122826.1 hypothetical protein [Sphingobium subterraneum]